MSKLTWGSLPNQRYEAGLDRGVLYPPLQAGVAWSGLISVEEAPTLSAMETHYFDGQAYLSRMVNEEFNATIKAFSYPKEFERFDGFSGIVSGQARNRFGFSYRTAKGSGLSFGDAHKIHLVYNAVAFPSVGSFETESENVEPSLFSWGIQTAKVSAPNKRTTAHIVVDTEVAWPETVLGLEKALYGTATSAPYLPTPSQVLGIFDDYSRYRIIDHGDGTWTAIGPDDSIAMVSATEFKLEWPTAEYLAPDTYRLSSL